MSDVEKNNKRVKPEMGSMVEYNADTYTITGLVIEDGSWTVRVKWVAISGKAPLLHRPPFFSWEDVNNNKLCIISH